jgi:ketosteroid isomerase-like protein
LIHHDHTATIQPGLTRSARIAEIDQGVFKKVTDMMTTRRRVVAAAAAGGFTSIDAAEVAQTAPAGRTAPKIEDQVAQLVQRSAQGNGALMRGDMDRYSSLITVADDFTLMSPFGGKPSRGSMTTREQREAIGRFFRNGTLTQEVVQTCSSADLIVLAVIEHCQVEVGGLPAQIWPLRVTLVYRREGLQWLLVHRHADSLAPGMSLKNAAAAARGEFAG